MFRTNSVRLNFFSLCVSFSKRDAKGCFLNKQSVCSALNMIFSSFFFLSSYTAAVPVSSFFEEPHLPRSFFLSTSPRPPSFQLLYFGKRQNYYLRRA